MYLFRRSNTRTCPAHVQRAAVEIPSDTPSAASINRLRQGPVQLPTTACSVHDSASLRRGWSSLRRSSKRIKATRLIRLDIAVDVHASIFRLSLSANSPAPPFAQAQPLGSNLASAKLMRVMWWTSLARDPMPQKVLTELGHRASDTSTSRNDTTNRNPN